MAYVDKMHSFTKALAEVIDKFDSNMDERFESQELKELLQKLYLHLSAHDGFKTALADANCYSRMAYRMNDEQNQEHFQEAMFHIRMLMD